VKISDIRLGTSAFTAEGWVGSFYPKGMKPVDFLSYYATKFNAVELDNTFYRVPAMSTVEGWNVKTPPGFLFTAKVPQVITHEKVLHDCKDDLNYFLRTMDVLGDRLGPLLLQFGYFNQKAFKTQAEFLERLVLFLKSLPKDYKFAVEIRNKNWMDEKFADVLRKHNVGLTLIDQSWVPRPWEMKTKFDMVTADFVYIRWLGDRKGIEAITESWDKVVVDRKADLKRWVEIIVSLVKDKRLRQILAFANNHYAGHAPATLAMVSKMLDR